ncbi:MAG: hypothetical protein AB1547_11995 [Thermodesulfobacteriota bacterium]
MLASKRSHFVLNALSWVGVPVLCGAVAVLLGQDANWDLRNYHYYNPYAFMTGRWDFDALAGQIATFYNPLLYIPFYYSVTYLPPKLTAFLIGSIQGLNFPLMVGIASRILHRHREADTAIIACFLSFAGIAGAGNISELGTMFSDNLLSLPVLLSLLLLLQCIDRLVNGTWTERLSILLAAGSLVGIAAGFKQTSAVYAVGMCIAFFAIDLPVVIRFVFAFVFGIGVCIGMAATGGFWLYEMWRRFGNPLFPYFNHVFHSPMAQLGDYRDVRFLPQTLGEYLMKVFCFAIEPREISEVSFRDWRIPGLYLFGLAAVIRRLSMRLSGESRGPSFQPLAETPSMEPFFFTFLLFSYLAWLKMFCIFRYAMVIEMLAPLGIWLLIRKLDDVVGRRRVLAWICMGAVMVSTVPADWGRVRWGTDYFGAELPHIPDPDRTLVVMTGTDPLSYLIPLFPPQIRFLRIQSYFNLYAEPTGYDRWMADRIAEHEGAIYVLYRSSDRQATLDALKAFNLKLERGGCTWFKPRIEENQGAALMFCRVEHVGNQE